MKEHNQKKKTQDGSKATFEITPNFKGNIYARAIDEAGNVSEEYKSAGTILENNGKHSTTSSIHILQETQEKKYYNHDNLPWTSSRRYLFRNWEYII